MKTLITGISGFVGPYLTKVLQNNKHKVFGTVKEEKYFHLENVETFSGDLLERSFVDKVIKASQPKTIFHLASFTSPADSFQNPKETILNNIGITVNLLEAARNVGTRVIVIGSADEYGLSKVKDFKLNEEAGLNPSNSYAVSKLTQDFLGLQYFLAYKLDTVRLRPGNQIGPGQSDKFVVSSFAKQIAKIEAGKQKPIIKVGNLNSIRDFTDVRDMVDAYFLASLHGTSGEVYNLGSGRGWEIKKILEILLSFSKIKIDIIKDIKKVRPADSPKIIINSDKFRKLTGWAPRIEIEQSLEAVLNYWRNNV